MKLGRNDPCHCGSGKKYKDCCLKKPVPRAVEPPSVELVRLVSFSQSGRHAELENRARLLIGQYPNSGFTWKLLGESLYMQGKESLPALQKATELLPDDADAFSNLAVVLTDLGRLDEAVSSCRRALKIKPDDARALNNLGNALLELGRLDEALASYRRALQIKPDYFRGYNNLGGVLLELGRPDEAVASYRRAIELKPDFAKAHSNLGAAMRELGWHDSELEHYRRALEIDPRCSEAILGMGKLCMASGEMAEAEAHFRKALEIKNDNLDARLLLAQVKKVEAGDENFAALVAMEDATRRSKFPLPYKKRILLHFALGKCFDDMGDYDRAFPHFVEGGKLKRATFAYESGQTTQYFRSIERVFNRATLERLRGVGNPSQVPIFVLGMPRSGTTLTEQIIASHPDVHGAGELPDLMAIARRGVARAGAPYPDNIPAIDQAGLGAWATDYVAGLLRRAPDARRITDKMPENFLAIGLIHTMLPNAKIIHVNRNPVDTCLSCFMQLFTSNQAQTYDLSELGRYYADYARLMGHWRSVLPAGAFLDVQYEDIVADQATQARRIIDFCGLEWDEACVDFHKNKRSIHTASLAQVRQPIYRSSVERWRPYEKFLGPLLDELGDLVPEAGLGTEI